MAFVLGDRAVQTSATTGTGTLSLDAPATGLRSFVTEVGSGNTTAFLVVDAAGNWEINIGTVTSGSPDTISRTNPPIKSSNSNNLVSFPAGSKTVACVPVASLIPYLAAVPSYSDGQILQRSSGAWATRTAQQVLATLMEAVGFTEIASAATTDLALSDDFTAVITGTETITSFGSLANAIRLLRFGPGITITNNANIVLRTGASRGTANGDMMLIWSGDTAVWREVAFFPADPRSANWHIHNYTFHYPGLVEAPSGTANKMLPMRIYIPNANYSQSLESVSYGIEDGTSVTFEIRKNGVAQTGFTGLTATTTIGRTTPAPITLADGDKIEVIHSSPSGSPHNLFVTVHIAQARNI